MSKSKKKMKASDIYSSSSSGGEENERRRSSSSSSSSSSVSSISSGESDTERHKSKKVVKIWNELGCQDLKSTSLSIFQFSKEPFLDVSSGKKLTIIDTYPWAYEQTFFPSAKFFFPFSN